MQLQLNLIYIITDSIFRMYFQRRTGLVSPKAFLLHYQRSNESSASLNNYANYPNIKLQVYPNLSAYKQCTHIVAIYKIEKIPTA